VFGAGELSLAQQAFESIPAVMNRDDSPLDTLQHLAASAAERRSDTVRQIAVRHLEKLREFDAHALRVVDKMPDNYVYLGWLVTIFPRAHFVHCRRDVRDVAVSCWITHFKSIHWGCDAEQIASRIEQYRRLMKHWRNVLPVPVLEIDYEQTVADLEGTARRLVDWIGLDWDPACLEFHRTERAVRTASLSQVRQPIYARSVGRWKNYESRLQSLLERIVPSG